MKRIVIAALASGLVFTTSAHADSFKNFSEATGDSANASARDPTGGERFAR